LKQDASPYLLYNFALDYAIRMVEVNQDGLKLNGTYQVLIYAYDVNMSGSVHNIEKKNRSFGSRY
jgi:hypothetical protein